MDTWLMMSGFVVGMVIGVTGMGGGLIMTPLLMFGFGMAPAMAVGTDLIFAATTKIFGAWQHWRQKTIDISLLKRVAMGSIPGTLIGMVLLYRIKEFGGDQLDSFISKALAFVFLFIAIVMLMQMIRNSGERNNAASGRFHTWNVIGIGFLVGLLVAITSVGSGTLFVALLLYLYPYSANRLVGTDILHGVLITGIAGIGHFFLGSVDVGMATGLLLGSIPGVLIGSKMSVKLPDTYIRLGIIGLLVASAAKLF
jgi:uncharacterized membrane protein YfcA